MDRLERLMAMWLAGLKGRTVKYYWENEKLVFDTNLLSKLKSKNIRIDTVVTHSAPSFCMPLLKTGIENWLLEDEHLEADMAEERQVMDSLYNWLSSEQHPVQNWF